MWIAPTLEELQHLSDRERFTHVDSLSGNRMERASFNGAAVVLKYVSVDDDWIMRAAGDLDCRLLRLLASDIPGRLPGCIDTAVIAVAPYMSRAGHGGAALLMRDVGAWMVPTGSDAIEVASNERFMGNMARMHAALWGYRDTLELLPLAHHYTFLTPVMAALEAARGGSDPVPRAVAEGWTALQRIEPRMASTLGDLARDPGPLVGALQDSPRTFIHADWKLGNLGEHPDGRTILLDWDRCGEAPPLLDLAWYLAVNCDRLPVSKEKTIALYRSALEQQGIETGAWWERQLALALTGAALQLCWAKVHDAVELGWWRDRVLESESLLA
ncbi:MAG: phosphotransferase [Candidatus Dormibacteraeota bacterium]|nr:phosphotransferase [Candidatus Dormibacteraeota bacterium]MBV9524237.1 phosphotransferase [Candidatus Dormibacteraeota bacterium]